MKLEINQKTVTIGSKMSHWTGGSDIKNKCGHKDNCRNLSPAWCIDCTQFNRDKSKMDEAIVILNGILVWRDDEANKNNQ